MSETVRVVISCAEYEDMFEWELWAPDPKYMSEAWLRSYGDRVYDVPKSLVEKYEHAINLRCETDEELKQIVKEKRGKYKT